MGFVSPFVEEIDPMSYLPIKYSNVMSQRGINKEFEFSNVETFLTATTPFLERVENGRLEDLWRSFDKASGEGVDVYF